MVDLHTQIEYKYVLFDKNGEHHTWEDVERNRHFVASGPEMTIEDDDGLYRSKQREDEQELSTAEELPRKTDGLERRDSTSRSLGRMKSKQVHEMSTSQKLEYVRALEGKADLDYTNVTVFMVAYQLPVQVLRKPGGGWYVDNQAPTDGRNFAFLPLVQELRDAKKLKVKCVGWPGFHAENESDKEEIKRVLDEHDCIPVFPPKKEFESYRKFCVDFLWPVFHDVMLFFQASNPRPFNHEGWADYQNINMVYARTVYPHLHTTDLVWIHDYHLMMTPVALARKDAWANVGFYLHTPFPSSDSFKSLPVREELMNGLLHADLVAFQFFAYARNFLTSAKRVFGLDLKCSAGGFLGVEYNGRSITIKVQHFVFPYQDTLRLVQTEQVERSAAQVKKLFKDKTVFACMDRCDNLSGLIPKFRVFKRFLMQNEKYRGKAVLVQYCFSSAAGWEASGNLLQALKGLADAELQTKDGVLTISEYKKEQPEGGGIDIFLRFEKIDRIERLGLFRAANVLLDTCVKAGLNLMPFEFIAAHYDDQEKEVEVASKRHSVVIASEFSGCTRVLMGSLRVNPWNSNELITMCEKAISMDDSEKKDRAEANLDYAKQNSAMNYFENFLNDLRRAQKKEGGGRSLMRLGFGSTMRNVFVGGNHGRLEHDEVLTAYRIAKNRVIFLDNEGTLANDKRNLVREYGAPKGELSDLKSHGSPPSTQVLECLSALCADPKNTVVILSGRGREMMTEWFDSVKGIGLAAERGFYYKLPMGGSSENWHCIMPNIDMKWKDFAFQIMQQFSKRTQGTFIENKGSALVWQYRDADQTFGSWQAKELSAHLRDLLFGFEVDVTEGKGYVEVKVRGVNKGTAVNKVLSKVGQNKQEDIDFVLAIGDDRSDEDMFIAVNQFGSPEAGAEADSAERSTTDDGSNEDSDRGPQDGEPASMLPRSSSHTGFQRSRGLGGIGGGSLKKGTLVQKGMSGDLSQWMSAGNEPSRPPMRFFTCVVGQKPSEAKFYLDEVEEVSELLACLKVQAARTRDFSAMPLRANKGFPLHRAGVPGSMPALNMFSQ